MRIPRLIVPLIICTAFALNIDCSQKTMDQTEKDSLTRQIARYAPVTLDADIGTLSEADRQVLRKLVEATHLLDSIYIEQVWSENQKTLQKLASDASEIGVLRKRLFEIEMAPWSSLDAQKPFIAGVPERPHGANYYPDGMTKDEFESWKAGLSKEQQAEVTGYFSVIRRDDKGGLVNIPFNKAYEQWLVPAAKLLREAADLSKDQTLKTFLSKRADAFLSNDYYESDVAWMELNSRIEPTIGPYEVYMDELFNYKAAYEAYIGVRNEAETQKLNMFGAHLQDIENHLPIDPKLRNPKLGSSSPIRVIDLVAVGGEARQGVQTAAFNLPNDERVIEKKGSKRVMLKNVQEAKFNKVLLPIASVALSQADAQNVSFEHFFTHILAHELMHGLGPHNITVAGKQTTVRKELKELSSAMEEGKADISGLFALQYLMDGGVLPQEDEAKLYTTFLASAFRSVRFGIGEAHGKGMAVQFNFLEDEGAFVFDSTTTTFSVDMVKIKPAVTKLTGLMMTLQAKGDYAGTKALLEKYGVMRPSMQKVLDKLNNVPTDIAPTYVEVR